MVVDEDTCGPEPAWAALSFVRPRAVGILIFFLFFVLLFQRVGGLV